MKRSEKILEDLEIFQIFSLFWVVFGLIGFVMSLAGFFYVEIQYLYLAGVLALGTYFITKGKIRLKPSKNFLWFITVSILVVFIFSLFVNPTVFSGRDQGSFSLAAIELSKNHQLEFSTKVSEEFFEIYGPGRALNFPGFYYTNDGELITQFPLGYISWLASFYAIFGITGLIVANSFLLFSFLLAMFLLAGKMFKKNAYAILLSSFILTSFSFAWFFKYTLSENMAMALLWTVILSVYLFVKKPSNLTFFTYITSATLLAFTRIEGFAFLLTSAVALFIFKESRKFLKKDIIKKFWLPLLIFIVIFTLNAIKDIYFFKEIAKALLDGVLYDKPADNPSFTERIVVPGFYMTQIHFAYGLAGFFLFGALGIIQLLWKRKSNALIPLLIVFPAGLYLIDSNISSDHPWLLRRFVFALLPLFILYTVSFFQRWDYENKKDDKGDHQLRKFVISFFIFILIIMNLRPFLKFAFFDENAEMLERTREISQIFNEDDLVLVKRDSSGDNWSMISGPLMTIFNKQAAYFFNPNDLDKIDKGKFDNIYIIVRKKEVPAYLSKDNFEVFKEYRIKTERLYAKRKDIFIPLVSLPQKRTEIAEGYILKMNK